MTSKSDKTRKALIREYGHLYKRISGVGWEHCIYCGDPMQVYDHVPPISIVDGLDIKLFKKKHSFRLFPSCSQCNRLLGSFTSTNIYERLDYLINKYEKRLDKIEIWDENELAEMGHSMRAHILNNQNGFEIINNKLTVLVERYCTDDLI